MDSFMAVAKLNKLFDEKGEDTTPLKKKDMKVYHDRAMVICLLPKTKRMKEIFESHFETENREMKIKVIDNLKFVPEKKEIKEEIKSRYAVDYLLKILALLKAFDDRDSVIIKMRKDYPLWVETDEFIIILVPRVED